MLSCLLVLIKVGNEGFVRMRENSIVVMKLTNNPTLYFL